MGASRVGATQTTRELDSSVGATKVVSAAMASSADVPLDAKHEEMGTSAPHARGCDVKTA